MLEGADLRFTLPTTVSPRYAPAEDRAGVGRPPIETLNPPLRWTVPYGLELALQLEMPEVIRKIESPSHPVSVNVDGSRGEVSLGTRQTAMDRDFVLIIEQQRAFVPRCAVEIDDRGQRAAVVWFRPEFEAKEISNEVVFLIDRSGSMAGTSITEARNALQLCLRSLPPGTHFNIVSFGSGFEMLARACSTTSKAWRREQIRRCYGRGHGRHRDSAGAQGDSGDEASGRTAPAVVCSHRWRSHEFRCRYRSG